MGIWVGMTDGIGVVGRGQFVFYEGSWFDEEGVSSSYVNGILLFFGLQIKGADEVEISKSISFIDLQWKIWFIGIIVRGWSVIDKNVKVEIINL